MSKYHQKLPGAGPKREALRRKGQFWTPNWVAEAMVGYVLAGGSGQIFDPAVGEGAFFRAAKSVAPKFGGTVKLSGTELDPNALQQARQSGLSKDDLSGVVITDFVLSPPDGKLPSIVANPPYIRHHRLSERVKAKLKKLSKDIMGRSIDGRAGLHIYFLLRALQLLMPAGRLAFIMPADTCEGTFARTLWQWISTRYCLDAVVTFTPEASPFPGVDTNPIVFLIRNDAPKDIFLWATCSKPHTNDLKEWVVSGFKDAGSPIDARRRQVDEGLITGLSRPEMCRSTHGPVLGDFAKVMRGIATGANEFFFLTQERASSLGLPREFLLPAIGRTRDLMGDEITLDTIKALDQAGRPTLLFSPDGRPPSTFPPTMREYLELGEAQELHKRTLIATRKPWYKMEVRSTPAFLFAYLGRRNVRFIRNSAGVVPLTGFLCVYPHDNDAEFINELWKVLRHPATVKNLALVGKSYGAGAIKVEPRGLEQLPIPPEVLSECELSTYDGAGHRSHRGRQNVLFAT